MKTLSKMNIPSPKLINLAKEYIRLNQIAIALKPVIDAIDQKVFDQFEFYDHFDGQRITNPQHVYNALDFKNQYTEANIKINNQIQYYFQARHDAITLNGYNTDFGVCPLLMAENKANKARLAFTEESIGLHNMITYEQLTYTVKGIDNYIKIIMPWVENFF